LRLFSFGGYGSALAALALVVFGAYDSYPHQITKLVTSACKKSSYPHDGEYHLSSNVFCLSPFRSVPCVLKPVNKMQVFSLTKSYPFDHLPEC